ncbi:MAG: DUF1847 domain-containing protein [Gemmatimonadota bacterium]|nr:MAG: DUF1847 domain-containing protein [Gemmatimonadota bacterium]
MAYESALVEAAGYCRWTRLREIVELANHMGHTCLGIAHCPEMTREASHVEQVLRQSGIDAALPPATDRCSPREQAELFETLGTQFNVIAGMCTGHDSVFIRASHVPVTTLIVSDWRLHHNPVAALYTSRSYLRSVLYDTARRSPRQPFRGWDMSALASAAERTRAKAGKDWCRIEEILEFAQLLGAQHLGMTFCVGLRNEAAILSELLRANGFTVSSACCKTGAVPKEALGIGESQKVRPNQPEMICNSLAQAELLNRAGVELALVVGQCVGHDSATMAHLAAPVLPVVAKDRVLAHNTVAALY